MGVVKMMNNGRINKLVRVTAVLAGDLLSFEDVEVNQIPHFFFWYDDKISL